MHEPAVFDLVEAPAALEDLSAALGRVAAAPYLAMSRRELASHVLELQGFQAQMDAIMAEASAAAHDAGAHLLDNLLGLPAYVAGNTNAEAKRVAGDRNLGQWLRGFPTFADAFRAGCITRQHVQALRALDNSRTHRRLFDAQDYLTEAAAHAGWVDFCKILQTWLLRADPDGDEPKAQVERRHLSVSQRPDGSVKGSFLLDPVHGAMLMNGVDQEEQRQMRATAKDDDRTIGQRRADALVSLVGKGAARADGTVPAPLVHITIGDAVAADLVIRLAIEESTDDPLEVRAALIALGLDPDELPLDPSRAEGRCHLADGTPIHPRLAAAALAAGTLRRLVLGADSEILDLGTAVRDFPRHFKDAAIAAHKGRCVQPKCDAPTTWLQADHRIPHSRQGPTAIRNCDPMCRPHNYKKRDQMPP